jgi:hypothetical protein
LAGILLASGGSATAIPNTTQCREWGFGRYTERDLLAAILLAVESGGGGGGPFLPLAGGTMDTNADIAFDNGSRIHQTPGANGIDQVCSIDYVHRWSSGLLYILDQINQIRVVKYGMSLVPDASYDSTQGYIVGSIFEQDGGNRYICTDDTPAAAVWIPFGASLIPTNVLQYKVVGSSSDVPYFSVKLNDGTSDIGETIIGFRGNGSGGGTSFIQGSSSNFRIEQSGGGLANLLANRLTITGGTVTASTPLLDLTQTWNNAGVTFVGHRLNVTDTASAAASLLLNLQIGGNNKWSVRKDGSIDVIDTAATDTVFLRKNGTSILRTGSSTSTLVSSLPFNCSGRLFVNGDTTVVPYHFAATDNNVTVIYFQLMGEAADVMAQRRGTNGQTFRLYGTFSDTSNYRRLNLSMSTAGVGVLRPEGLGSGASGNVLHISGLPTSNPGPGILWNNLGIPAIGT